MSEHRHKVISASAGSGKTTRLAFRYIELLASHTKGSPASICAITFTRKAAGEILDKIVDWLVEAVKDPKKAKIVSDEALSEMHDGGFYAKLLNDLLRNIHQVNISTIDSLITRIAGTFPYELGIPAEFSPADSDSFEIRNVFTEVIADIMRDRESSQALIDAYRESSVGKEEISISEDFIDDLTSNRYLYLSCDEATKWGDLKRIFGKNPPAGITADQAVAAAEEIKKWLNSGEAKPEKFKEALMKVINYFSSYTSMSISEEQGTLFDRLMLMTPESDVISYGKKDVSMSAAAADAARLLAKHYLATEIEKASRKTKGLYQAISYLNRGYFEKMLDKGLLTFTDILYVLSPKHATGIFDIKNYKYRPLSQDEKQMNRLFIDYRLDSRLDHWLLDEFQDTSDLQWDTIENLIDEVMQSDEDRTFFYVGDVKQSIYRFRGGNPELFEMIRHKYKDSITQDSINTTYRCSKSVIDAVNRVFTGIKDVADIPAAAAAKWSGFWEKHKTHNENEGYVALYELDSKAKKEARLLKTAELIKAVDPVRNGLTAAVLVSSNKVGHEAVQIFKQECAGIDFVLEGSFTITGNQVAQVLLALVKIAAHPGDTMAWNYLMMSPLKKYFEDERIDRKDLSLLLLDEIDTGRVRSFISRWGAILLGLIKEDNGFAAYSLRQLVIAAEEFDRRSEPDCNLFLRYISDYSFRDYAAERAVRVMTIHQAKGLEFDVVFLPELQESGSGHALNSGAEDMLIAKSGRDVQWILKRPSKVSEYEPTLALTLEKDRADNCFDLLCKLYVGMTRAKKALYMITSAQGKTSTSRPLSWLVRTRLSVDSVATPEAGCALIYESNLKQRRWYESGLQAGRDIESGKMIVRLESSFAKAASKRYRHKRYEPSEQTEFKIPAHKLFERISAEKKHFGTCIHELFERIEWLESDAQIAQTIKEWDSSSQMPAEVKRDAIGQFRDCMANPAIRAFFTKTGESRTEIWRERSFDMLLEKQFVTGIFDRVMIKYNTKGKPVEAVILDYKSSMISDAYDIGRQIEIKKDHYKPQMDLYRKALAGILKIPESSIAAKLIFTRPGTITDV